MGIVACTGNSGGGGAGSASDSTTNVPENAVSCPTGALFSVAPVDLSGLSDLGITPLGNLNPPAHTNPTPHLYFYIKHGNSGTVAGNVPVYAPGDMVISSVISSTNSASAIPGYSITFYPCDKVQGYFNHMTTVSAKLKTAFDSATGSCTTYSTGGQTYTRCGRAINVTVKAGEQIGTAGDPASPVSAMDFGLFDTRVTPLVFANNARIQADTKGFDQFHIVCAIDYYDDVTKAQLLAKLDRIATALPLCGTFDQDKAGTAQGSWHISSAAAPVQGDEDNLALVHDTHDPSIPVFSVGNSTLGVGTWSYTTALAGVINRDFADITPDGKTYCMAVSGGIFILKLTDATTLQIEKQPAASCPQAPTLSTAAMTFLR